ncbi:MAG TPA: class III extradiol dioxygenase subunit beta [Acidimicrobiia bacterium]|nr:class III extradiol dioxygenase subunit beta [Acidimicrobiia bacterium]
MAEVAYGVATSHTPSIGVAIDNDREEEPYWAPLFHGYEAGRKWIADAEPDVIILAYNDHASAFDLDLIPTFALGVADEFPIADEGYGPRDIPIVEGHSELAWHLAESLILDGFDMTICNHMPVDHGLTVPLSIMYGKPDRWPAKVIPLAVNVIQYPPPTGKRCWDLGQAIRRIVHDFDEDLKVAVFGTGGMSHQLQGERAGWVNTPFDKEFLDKLVDDPVALTRISHTRLLSDAGSEGIELVMWLIMRGALGRNVREVHRHYHVPASNTAAGLMILESEEHTAFL